MVLDGNKSNLRKLYNEKRSALSGEDVQKKSTEINQNFIKNLLPKIYKNNSDKIFSIYLPYGNEVRTDVIADYFSKNHVTFSYPKIIKKHHHLEFVLAEQNQSFIKSDLYNFILEPVSEKKVFPDYLLIPLLAFDKDLSRLGAGGGFFDRTIEFLKRRNPNIITIGLAYAIQMAKSKVPIDCYDQKLCYIVTEKNIFLQSKPRLDNA